MSIQKSPLKLFIQDIYRAKQSEENKYVYEIFGLKFKNIQIHGVVTCIYNNRTVATNLELSDPTGTVHIYFDSTKSNTNVSLSSYQQLNLGFEKASRFGDVNIQIMNNLMSRLIAKRLNKIDFKEGSYLSIIGDIFVDEIQNIRMVSAYDCKLSSLHGDIIWLEELNYLYKRFYIRSIT